MKQTPLEEKISNLVQPAIAELGFDLFMVKVIGEAGSKSVQIMAEDPETGRLGIDDCTAISRAVSALLDVDDPVSGAYRLEVSSPGIDRFLIRPKDFETYKGFEIKLELDMPASNGQKKFRGVINAVKDNNVIALQTDTGEVDLTFDSIAKAKLIMSAELIKATATKKA